MNKSDFVTIFAERAVLSKRQAMEAFNVLFELVREEVQREGRLRIDGFGTFDIVDRQARTARNPQTGATIQIPARKEIRFKASSVWKQIVNEKDGE